ncbi:MAG: hypothetical protein ACXVJH_05720 [Acidimicrobiia bacterium]
MTTGVRRDVRGRPGANRRTRLLLTVAGTLAMLAGATTLVAGLPRAGGFSPPVVHASSGLSTSTSSSTWASEPAGNRPIVPSPPAPPSPTTSTTTTTTTTAPPVWAAVVASAVVAPAVTTGCADALAYLAAHQAPGFVDTCGPGTALGRYGYTCWNVAATCPNAKVIHIACPAPFVFMNEAHNSWSLQGLRSGVDPFGQGAPAERAYCDRLR